jgi:hypothetical protein
MGRPSGQLKFKALQVLWHMKHWPLHESRPSNKRLAVAMGCSISQVKNYLALLKVEGYLKTEREVVRLCKDGPWLNRRNYQILYTGPLEDFKPEGR